jgi:N-methylhydantoinase A
MSSVIGIDIGGTFTDGILLSEGGVTIGKVPSTPPTFHEGFINAIGAAAEARGRTLEEVTAEASGIYHGSTIAINALVEGRGARCAMLTTRGHRDTHSTMQAGKRFYGEPAEVVARVSQQLKPEPLVPKDRIFDVDERVGSDGRIVVGLNEAQACEAIDAAVAAGAEAIAVCLLWSVREPAHELRLRELIEERAPEVFVSLSHEVVARAGEYERGVATILNSMVGPVTGDYLTRLEARLRELNYGGRLQIMSSSGGLIDADQARRFPVLTLGSGPVAGLVGSAKLGEHLAGDDERANVIATDMGGTTFDIGIVRSGEPIRKNLSFFEQFAYSIPQIDMRSVGSGGGSIVRYDEISETLRVGPQSAGADPGPACYRRGGTQATVTDADLVLGYLNAERFAGGNMSLDLEASRKALAAVGEPLGMEPQEVAAAAVRIVDNQMADAIRLATIQQGLDPRDFTIYAYGGAGPVHASGYGAELGVSKIVVPLSDLASGWSAFGVANSDALVSVERALPMRNPFDAGAFNEVWQLLEAEATEKLVAGGIPAERISLERYAEMRYATQVNELEVNLPGGEFGADTDEVVCGLFNDEYARVFGAGSGFSAAGYAVSGVSVRARARAGDYQLSDRSNRGSTTAEAIETRPVIWYQQGGSETRDTPIYLGEDLGAEARIEGPAIVEFPDTALVLRDGATLTFDRLEDAVIEL